MDAMIESAVAMATRIGVQYLHAYQCMDDGARLEVDELVGTAYDGKVSPKESDTALTKIAAIVYRPWKNKDGRYNKPD